MDKTIGSMIMGILIFLILLPIERAIFGYLFKTSEIVKLLKEIKNAIKKE